MTEEHTPLTKGESRGDPTRNPNAESGSQPGRNPKPEPNAQPPEAIYDLDGFLSQTPGLKELLAEKIGISKRHFQMMMNGEQPWGKYKGIMRLILDAAGYKSEEFIFRETPKSRGSGGEPRDDKPYTLVYLEHRGWSLNRLADKLPYSRGHIQRVVHGRPIRGDPVTGSGTFRDLHVMKKIADCIGVNAYEIPWMHPDQQHWVKTFADLEAEFGPYDREKVFAAINKEMAAAGNASNAEPGS